MYLITYNDMVPRSAITFLALIGYSIATSQEPIYFNNIYQNQDNYAVGLTILETDDGYVGYGGTEDQNNIGQMLLLYKINKQGEELIWKPFGENYHSYYPGNFGGAMIKTDDGNFALAYHAQHNGIGYSSFMKLNNNLDTIWKRDYTTDNLWTLTMNCNKTQDNGYILSGSVKPAEDEKWDVLLLKTDSDGNMQWYNSYGTETQEQGSNAIETSDGGYLIGGFIYTPNIDHSLDALVIKTDSLGNEEWTQYYGNPDVDDDMALVALADDGNYLVATVYGDQIISSTVRNGRPYFLKIDQEGTLVWENKIGPLRRSLYIKNFRKKNNEFIATGFSNETDSTTFLPGQ